jgi:hypothetical protein
MPTVVALLVKRQELHDQERAAAPSWAAVTYEGEPINLMFTTPSGGLVLRQAVAKVVKQAAKTAGIAVDLATHAGRRTVVTTLFMDGDEALEDIARFVGHTKPATIAGYVKRLGRRPEAVAKRAAAVLDAQGRRSPWGSESGGRFWEQRRELRLRDRGITCGTGTNRKGWSQRISADRGGQPRTGVRSESYSDVSAHPPRSCQRTARSAR